MINDEMLEKISDKLKKPYVQMKAEDFERLPRKCKELFFACMESDPINGDEYIPFYVSELICKEAQSPIEQIFYTAFNIVSFHSKYNFYLIPQYVTNTKEAYRSDFAFETDIIEKDGNLKFKEWFCLLIECDGHEYHNSSKDQVARDNKRDYELKKLGYDILHFSGSQIYRDPIGCAKDVYSYILNRIEVVQPCQAES